MGTHSTLRRMPTEIICEIFSHLSAPLKVNHAHEFPWYLGQICSQWRTLFLSMQSAFWQEIEIDWLRPVHDSHIQRSYSERIEEIFTFFLNCTRAEPFSFTLFRCGYSKHENSSARWILHALLEHSRQWDQVHIVLELPEVRLLCAAKGRLTHLKRLELIVFDPDNYQHDDVSLPQTVCNLFHDAPLLTHVIIPQISNWKLNWSSLTVLDLRSASIDNVGPMFNVLRETINLVKLAVNPTFMWYGMQMDNEVSTNGLIHLPRLKCLSLKGVELLIALEVPTLQRLKITFYDDDDPEIEDAGIMVAFLSRSRLRLDTFITELAKGATIKEVLPYMPDLENLIFRKTGELADVFDWLAERSEPRISCLTVLSAFNDESVLEHEDLKALHDMVVRRNPPGDVRNLPSPPKLFLQAPEEVGEALERLKSLCVDRAIRLQFVNVSGDSRFDVNEYIDKFQ